MDRKTPYQSGREVALKQLENICRHNYRRHAPHGIWNMVPPVDEPHIIEATCQMMGMQVEDNLQQALVLLQQGKRLEDICPMDMINGYEPLEEDPEDYDLGRLSAFADARLLILVMDGEELARPVRQDPIMQAINPEESHLAVKAIKIYAGQVVRHFLEDIRSAYEEIAPGQYQATFARAASKQPPPKEPQSRKEKFWDWWDRSFRFWWSLPKKGSQPQTLPKIWPPLVDRSEKQNAGSALSGQDLFSTFYNGFQKLHFTSIAKGVYESQIMQDTGRTDTPVRSVAFELFDDIRKALRDHKQDADCKDCAALRSFVRQTLDAVDAGTYGEKYKGGEESARWLLNHWTKQTDHLLLRLDRSVPSSAPHTPPPSPQ